MGQIGKQDIEFEPDYYYLGGKTNLLDPVEFDYFKPGELKDPIQIKSHRWESLNTNVIKGEIHGKNQDSININLFFIRLFNRKVYAHFAGVLKDDSGQIYELKDVFVWAFHTNVLGP